MQKLSNSHLQTLDVAFELIPFGELHQPPPSHVPEERACGKRRGFSPGAAARHSQSARVHTEFHSYSCFIVFLFKTRRDSDYIRRSGVWGVHGVSSWYFGVFWAHKNAREAPQKQFFRVKKD